MKHHKLYVMDMYNGHKAAFTKHVDVSDNTNRLHLNTG